MMNEHLPQESNHRNVVQCYEAFVDDHPQANLFEFMKGYDDLTVKEISTLVQYDLSLRFPANRSIRLDDYLRKLDILRAEPDELLDLIDTELVLRYEAGELPELAEYLERFPTLSEELSHLFEVHSAETDRDAEVDLETEATSDYTPGRTPEELQSQTNLYASEGSDSQTEPTFDSDLNEDSVATALTSHLTSRFARRALGKLEFDEQLNTHVFRERFVLSSELGRGAFGTVWLAKDMQLDRQVAIKMPLISADTAAKGRSFVEEAKAAAILRHSGIMTVFDVDEYVEAVGPATDQKLLPSRVCIASAFLKGRTLRKVLSTKKKEGQKLAVSESVELMRKLASALYHAHQSGVIHRDLKPANVMMVSASEPVVMDFGLASKIDGVQDPNAEESIAGTIPYMSPEQARGVVSEIDHRTDIFTLGVMMFELIAGERPATGKGVEWIAQLASESFELQKLRDLMPSSSEDLAAICEKCMSPKPDDRYQSCRELETDLENYQRGLPVSARPLSGTQKLVYSIKRNPRLATAIATAVALLILVAISSTAGYVLVSKAKGETELANQALKAKNQELEHANALTLSRLQDARESVDSSLTGFADLLEFYPRAQQAREFALEQAAQKYEKFANDHTELPDLELERSRALIRLGKVRRLQGKLVESLEALTEAEETLNGMAENQLQHPDQRQLELATTWTNIAILHGDQGKVDLTEQYFNKSRKVFDEPPGDEDLVEAWQDAKATNLLNYGFHATNQNKIDDAHQALLSSAEIFARLTESNPRERRYLEGFATAESLIGNRLRVGGQHSLALVRIENAAAAFEQLHKLAKDHVGYIQRKADTRLFLVAVLHELGRHNDEQEQYTAAIDDLTLLTESVPGVLQHIESLALTRLNLARLQNVMGANYQAEQQLLQAMETLSALVAAYPETVRYEQELATCQLILGMVSMDLGRYEEARELLTQATARFESLSQEFSDVYQYRQQMSTARAHLARVAASLEDTDAAQKHFEQSLVEVGGILIGDSPVPEVLRTAAHIRWRFGNYLHSQDEQQRATEQYKLARQHWSQLTGKAESATIDQLDFAQFLVACRDQSLRNPRQAIRLLKAAIKVAPDNPDLYGALGAAMSKAELHEEAAQAMETAMELRKGGNDRDWYTLSAIQVALSDPNAQQSLQKGVQWQQQFRPGNELSTRFREEAESLSKSPDQTGAE